MVPSGSATEDGVSPNAPARVRPTRSGCCTPYGVEPDAATLARRACEAARAVEVSTTGPTEPSRVIGASRTNAGHWPIRVCWAHGTRGAIRRVADDLRWALLTEIGPAVDTSTARLHRRSSEESLLASRSYDLMPPLLNRSRNDRA